MSVFAYIGRSANALHRTATDPSGKSRRARKDRNQRERADGRKVEDAQSAGEKKV